MNRPVRPLKKLGNILGEITTDPNLKMFEKYRFHVQDETRIGLITKQKKVLSRAGVDPIGTYQHSFKYIWLWGSLQPETGQSHYMITERVNKQGFEAYLKELSTAYPDSLNIVLIDNAGFHSTKGMELPANIHLVPLPPYSPELNPAEKMWQYIKDRVAMKTFSCISALEEKVTQIINQIKEDTVKSITSYQYITDAIAVIS